MRDGEKECDVKTPGQRPKGYAILKKRTRIKYGWRRRRVCEIRSMKGRKTMTKTHGAAEERRRSKRNE